MRSALASDSGAINPTRSSAGKKRRRKKTPLQTSDDGGASSSSIEVPEKTMAVEEVVPVVSGPATSEDMMPAPQWAPVRRRGAVSPATSVESISTSAASLASGDETFRDLDLALVNLGKLLSTVAAKGAEPGSSYRKRLREGAAMVKTRLIPTMSKLYNLVASREGDKKGLVAQLDPRESNIPGDSPALRGGTPLSPMPALTRSGPLAEAMDTDVPSRAAKSVPAPMPVPTPVASIPRAPTSALSRPPRRVELRPALPPRISAAPASVQRGVQRPAPAQTEDIRSPLARMVDEWPALPRPRSTEPSLSAPRAVGPQSPHYVAAGMREVNNSLPSKEEMVACISRAVAVEVGKHFASLEEMLRSSVDSGVCVLAPKAAAAPRDQSTRPTSASTPSARMVQRGGRNQNSRAAGAPRSQPQSRSLPPPPSNMDEGWTEVVKKGNRVKGQTATLAAPRRGRAPINATQNTALVAMAAPREGRAPAASKKKRERKKPRAARSAAVVVTLLQAAAEKEIGAEEGLRFRHTANGAKLLECPGANSSGIADKLVATLRVALPEEDVRVHRPASKPSRSKDFNALI
ncbi:serine/arginine repetitive matrix protein 1-like [Bombyx mori]|uniref:serine/arginine repetitive matrix protein 1-like n=1 Tax=Bombyx mori TaxID=7091 RepID=UPI002ED33753